MWSLSQEGLQTWAQEPGLAASQGRAMDIYIGGSSLLGSGMGLGLSTSGSGVSSPDAPATNIFQGGFTSSSQSGNIECQEGKLGEGRGIRQKLYYPSSRHGKQPTSFNGLS